MGKDWRERVSGPIHGVAWGEHDPEKGECRGKYWSPVRNLNCYPQAFAVLNKQYKYCYQRNKL